MNDKLKEMMDRRKIALGLPLVVNPSSVAEVPETGATSCFGVQAGEGFSEHFLELRFASGDRVAFPYANLTYLNYDHADSRIDLNFRGYVVSIEGQNLGGELCDRLLDCRVRWIAEASGEIVPEDAPYVFSLLIVPPATLPSGEEADGQEG